MKVFKITDTDVKVFENADTDMNFFKIVEIFKSNLTRTFIFPDSAWVMQYDLLNPFPLSDI